MPIYEYRCRDCGRVFARIRSVASSSEPIDCPHCASDRTERLPSTFAAGPSGSGFGGSAGTSSCGGGGG